MLAALSGGEAMTAGQVAQMTDLARGTISTTLSNLAKSGELQKARAATDLHPPARPSRRRPQQPPNGPQGSAEDPSG